MRIQDLSYAGGESAPTEIKQMVRWLRTSAQEGEAEAQHYLGKLLNGGDGIPQNTTLAYAWLSVAVASGYDKARLLRDEIAQNLSPVALDKGQALAAKYFEKYQPSSP